MRGLAFAVADCIGVAGGMGFVSAAAFTAGFGAHGWVYGTGALIWATCSLQAWRGRPS